MPLKTRTAFPISIFGLNTTITYPARVMGGYKRGGFKLPASRVPEEE
jgi:hypothetical protein